MAKQATTLAPPGQSYRLIGLHPNIRFVKIMALSNKQFDLQQLTDEQASELLAVNWEHIEAVPETT